MFEQVNVDQRRVNCCSQNLRLASVLQRRPPVFAFKKYFGLTAICQQHYSRRGNYLTVVASFCQKHYKDSEIILQLLLQKEVHWKWGTFVFLVHTLRILNGLAILGSRFSRMDIPLSNYIFICTTSRCVSSLTASKTEKREHLIIYFLPTD